MTYITRQQVRDRIAALEAENAALKAERDSLKRMNNTAVNVINHHIRHGNNEGNALALIELVMAAEDERDAARAWAAAWRKAAKRWQNELLTPRTVTFRVEKDLSQSSIDRRAQRRAERITSNRRAAEAAEAMERR